MFMNTSESKIAGHGSKFGASETVTTKYVSQNVLEAHPVVENSVRFVQHVAVALPQQQY